MRSPLSAGSVSGKVSWVAIVPFFASGFTNAFVAAPLQYCVFWLVIGVLLRARREHQA